MWNLSRGARSLTSLDLTACVSVTDAGIAHLASAVAGAGAQQQDRLVQEAGGGLQELRLDGLPELSDVGIDSLCPAAGAMFIAVIRRRAICDVCTEKSLTWK